MLNIHSLYARGHVAGHGRQVASNARDGEPRAFTHRRTHVDGSGRRRHPRPLSAEAVKITTQNLILPHGEELERAIEPLRSDPGIGGRMSRKAYEDQLVHRDEPARPESPADFAGNLAEAYKRKRRGGA